MNKQIKQIALETGLITPQDDEENWQEYINDVRKFAQLLIFECVNAVMDGTKEGDHYAQRIEQHFDNGPGGILHFGIEE